MASAGNSMSTTGPMTRETRPTPAAPGDSIEVSSRTVLIALSSTLALAGRASNGVPSAGGGGGVGEGVRATDDLADLLGDLGLTGVVRQPRVAADRLVGVVRRRLHGALARGELARRGHEHRVEHAALDVLRQQRVEHRRRVRLELVQRQD